MVDTGNSELNVYLNGEFAKAGTYNPACATDKSQVALTTCPSGCLATHVTGSVVLTGKLVYCLSDSGELSKMKASLLLITQSIHVILMTFCND